MMKKLLRLLRIAPLALVFAGVASAQTTGTIIGVVTDASTGKPVAGAVVIATSPNLQGEQTAVTDGNGNYRITLLPPGEYKLAVQLEGFKPSDRSDIRLSTDKTLRANLAVVPESVTIDEQVVRTGTAPVVNVGSAESGAVVTSEFVAAIPVGRTFNNLALVAPTAQSDLYGVGFSGSQSPENSYIVDGLSVNDPVLGSVSTNLLSNFVQEVDVKTGSYSAEYGRSTGGVVNVVTKAGSNEFHGSVFGTFDPNFLVKPDGTPFGRSGEAVVTQNTPGEGDYRLDFGGEVGGPVIKDRLWFYAGVAPIINATNYSRSYQARVVDAAGAPTFDANGAFIMRKLDGSTQVTEVSRKEYQFTGKLTYLVDENNQVALSTFGSPINQSFYVANAHDPLRTVKSDGGNYDFIGKYAGKFLDKRMIVEALAGYHLTLDNDAPTAYQKATPAQDWITTHQVSAFEALTGAQQAACINPVTATENLCPVGRYRAGGYGFGADSTSDRLNGKLSAAYLLEAAGSHNWKAGIDLERNTFNQKKYYGGARFYRARGNSTSTSVTSSNNSMQVFRGYGSVPDKASPDTVNWFANGQESDATTNSFSYYLQDQWTITNTGVTINAGLRLETQSMEAQQKGGTTVKGININDMWSPRLQAIWDFTGTGRGKVAASWGRFYYSIPLQMGDRAFGNEQSAQAYFRCSDPGTGANRPISPATAPVDAATDPNCAAYPRFGGGISYTQIGGISPVDPNLKGSYVDQFGGQVEYELMSDLSVGFDYQGHRQGTVIEDMSSDDGANYFIANPNAGKPFNADYLDGNPPVPVDPKNMVTFDPVTGREITVLMPKPERSYDGFTFRVTKNFSQNWLAQASYTYSTLRGNYNGVFRPEDGQFDPGITSDYDLPTLMANRTGWLSAYTPHTFKFFGAYNFKVSPKMSLTASGTFNALSGQAQNALGGHPQYGSSQAFIIQRGAAGRSDFQTTLDLGGRFEYTITPPYAIKVSLDVFNVFNSQKVLNYDEDYTFDSVQPIVNLKCDSKAVGSSNPGDKLRSDCPDVAYLKTIDGNPVTVNPNFGKPVANSTSYQTPLSLRIGLALTF